MPDPSRMAPVRSASHVIGVTEQTLRRYINLGLVPAYRMAGVRGLLVDVDEARHELAKVPAAKARPHYGKPGPEARIRTIVPAHPGSAK